MGECHYNHEIYQESIASAVESARIAVSTISGMQSDAVEKALEIYKDSQDMA